MMPSGAILEGECPAEAEEVKKGEEGLEAGHPGRRSSTLLSK
jgi:hypothetical protein